MPGLSFLSSLLPHKATATLNLALQGGGAHGAFTWGVLDTLLDDERLTYEGLSGSSAGAMNAVVMAEGWRTGGREGAREALASFWSELGRLMPFDLLVTGQGENIDLNGASKLMMKWVGQFSPEQLNPFELNALRDLLLRHVDFDALRRDSPFKLFIGTTQANTGRLRLFRETELSVEVLLASACLPRLHHAVTIDGEPYWDGGYAANPAVFPLFYDCESRDVMLVLLSPLRYEITPRSVEQIEQRSRELSFSTNLLRELQGLSRAADYAGASWLPAGRLERRLRGLRFHMIDTHALASAQRTETKLIAHLPFLELLRDQGRARAQDWRDEHGAAVGHASSVDLKQWLEA